MENNELNKKILKYLNNEFPDSEIIEFENSLKESEEIENYYNDIKEIYEATQSIEIPEFDYKKAFNKTSKKFESKKFSKKRIVLSISKIAAILIIGLFIGILVSKNLNKEKDQLVEIYVKKGERVNITLPDGNKIYINSNTSIKYPANFVGNNRKIILEGEAYFDFQSLGTNPILVCARDNIIYGNNNSFNIKNYPTDDNIELIVEKGWLSIFNPNLSNNSCLLEAGDKGTINDLMPLFVEKAINYNALAWKTGKLEFDNTPLRIVANELANCYNLSIEINDDIQYCRFSSAYDNESLDIILNDLENKYDFTISRGSEKIIISGADC